jgi:hypothetical protein
MTDIRRVEVLMRGHEARPLVLPARWSGSWYRGPFLTTANRMHGDAFPTWFPPSAAAPLPVNDWWRYLTPWFKIFAEESPTDPRATLHNAPNTRIQIRNIRLFVRRSSWTLEQTVASPPSDLFSYDLVTPEVLGGFRDESGNGGGNSVVILNGGTRVPHGYGTPRFVADPENVTGIAVDMDCRLILGDPMGIDDRASARALVAIACDLYYNTGQPMPSAGYWLAVGAAGFARVTNDWQRVGFNSYFTGARPEMDVNDLRATYSSSLILASAPDGWTDGGSPPAPDPNPTPTPPPVGARKLLFIGDSYVRGDEGVAGSFRSWRGKALNDLAGAGLSVDSVGREVLASAGRTNDPEHEGHADARISTTTNNITTRLDAIMAGVGGGSVAPPTGGVNAIPSVSVRVEVVVLMLGLTDYESEATGIADRYTALFDLVRVAQPTADIIVVTLPPRQGLTEAGTNSAWPGYAELNSRIRQIAASTYGVTLADLTSIGLVSADYQSAALPLQSGADKIGAVIAAAIRSALNVGAAYIIPGAPRRPTVSLRTVSSNLHVFKWGTDPTAPVISTTSIANGQVGVPYSVTLAVTGTPAPTVSVTTGTLPAGLSLTGSTISGTPTTAASYTFTVSATNDTGTAARTYTVVISAATNITTTTLPSVATGAAFALPLAATGTAPISWVISTRGTLPTTVQMIGNTLSGTIASAASHTFTVDAFGPSGTDSQELTLTAVAAGDFPVITTTALASGTVGVSYSQTVTATGAATITYGASGLPAGLSLNTSTGAITGTPTAAGLYIVTISASNANPPAAAVSFPLRIEAVAAVEVASPWARFTRP